MKFVHPGWFWALLALPLIFLIIVWDERRRRARFARFAAEPTWKSLAPEVDFRARTRKAIFWILSLAFAITAMARPQWGMHEETAKMTGLDVMFVLDLSNSMEVEDTMPSRLEKAKHLIKSIVQRIDGDRVGLVTFGASASVSCPLTTDTNYMQGVLEMMTPKMVATQGTDIGLGLETARRAMERGGEEGPPDSGANQSHVIVLISDGEDWEGAAIDAAARIKKEGAKFFVFGVGSAQGGPIPVRDEDGSLVAYKKDRHGQPIISHFKPDALMQIAKAGGGKYWTATDNETEVDAFVHDIAGMNRSEFGERKYMVFEERFQYPLFIAVLLLLIEMAIPARKLMEESAESGARALIALVLVGTGLLMAPRPVEAAPLNAYIQNEKGIKDFQAGKVDRARQEFGSAQAVMPNSPALLFNQGVVELQQGDAASAIQSFGRAAQASRAANPKLAARSFYNMGEALAKKGDFKNAARSYVKAIETSQLANDPQLEAESRKNLQLLHQQKQQQKQQQQKKNQQKNNQQQKQDQNQSKQNNQQQNQGQDQQQKQQQKQQQNPDQPKRYSDQNQQQFNSKKLTPQDADRVMEELRHQERDLEAKLRTKKATAQTSEHDW